MCDDCSPGRYSDVSGATTCTYCGTGRFSSVGASISELDCHDCEYGKVNIYPASSMCVDCGVNEEPSLDKSQCTCKLGNERALILPSGKLGTTTGVRLQQPAGSPVFDSFGVVEGRIEIFHNGEWGTICGIGFDSIDAGVVCQQIANQKR